VAALTGAGFVDLCGAHWSGPGGPVGATVPTGYAGAEFPRTRLDYALGTPPVARAALACRVVVDGAARTASDHYPLAVDLSMRARGLST
jgi:endonuclease/exonuclease/phosphatase family metal-dependent hydrolase